MAFYSLCWHNRAKRELKRLPKADIAKIITTINALQINPLPNGHKKLTGRENNYRIRQGNYRIIYTFENQQLIIEIIRVAHRREVYRNL
ncbi:type II toxin-antitoxin system RelE/ParE family toxin [Ectothiorhodospiraceae bacterium BW-2]|nr:type II toxin-antitoxin system RelE/ParE family toxin [Ectothiorhodospiraceae bacterium BW-2]